MALLVTRPPARTWSRILEVFAAPCVPRVMDFPEGVKSDALCLEDLKILLAAGSVFVASTCCATVPLDLVLLPTCDLGRKGSWALTDDDL